MNMKYLIPFLLTLAALNVSAHQEIAVDKYIDEVPVWTVTNTAATEVFRQELIDEVTRYLALTDESALQPTIIQRGIGGYLGCFGNPAEVAAALVDVSPLLSPELAERAKARALQLIKTYPPWESAWNETGPSGAWHRQPEHLKLNESSVPSPSLGQLYFLWKVVHGTGEAGFVDEHWEAIAALAAEHALTTKPVQVERTDLWHRPSDKRPMTNIYGRLSIGAIQPGTLILNIPVGEDKQIEEIRDTQGGRLQGKLGSTGTIDYRDGTYQIQLPDFAANKRISVRCKADPVLLYSDVAGLIGYARLAALLDKDEAAAIRDRAQHALQRAALYGYNTMYQLSHRYHFMDHNHDGMYCPFHITRKGKDYRPCSVLFADEVGRLLKESEAAAVDRHMQAYIDLAGARAWWQQHGLPGADTVNGKQVDVPGGDGFGGENCNMGPYIGWTFYMLKAYVTEAPQEKLRMWIDIPWARTGDHTHWQRLAAYIRAHNELQWQPLP